VTERKSPNLETKLASALLALGLVPYEDAKAMGRTNFLSLWNYDHNIRHIEDGTAEFWNLTPLLIPAHRIKTATIDAPAIAKNRDIRTSEAIHKARLASRAGDYHTAAEILASAEKPSRLKPKRKIPSRPLRSRNTFERRA
jgi:hypothetical protein